MLTREQKILGKIRAQFDAGKFGAAAKAAQAAARQFPGIAEFPNYAGFALAQTGRHKDAAVSFSAALNLAPGTAEIENNLLQALVLSDQHDKVDALVARWLPKRQNPGDLHYLQALSHVRRDQAEFALAAVDKAIAASPRTPRSHYLRANILAEMRDDTASLDALEAITELVPQDPTPLLEMAPALVRLSRTDQAQAALDRALRLAPDLAEVHDQLGALALMHGRADDAKNHYSRAIKADPGRGMACFQLARLNDSQANRAFEQHLIRVQKAADPRSKDFALISFARAVICKQAADLTGEAQQLKLANRAEADRYRYDARRADTAFADLTGLDIATLPPAAPEDPVPVFVLGLPRSGTSLLEQILTASAPVFGCGEFGGGEAVEALARKQGYAHFPTAEAAALYRSKLPEMPAGTTHFVDKLPGNYKHLGLLAAAFPNARFLQLDRDPRDVALSMWRAYMSAPALSYVYDQTAMAHEVNLYQRYMAHWKSALADRILTVPYERLVTDIEAVGQDAAAFCGIGWTADMATPETNRAIVRTASALQVRDKVHAQSVGLWRTQEKALAEFTAHLDPALWPGLDR